VEEWLHCDEQRAAFDCLRVLILWRAVFMNPRKPKQRGNLGINSALGLGPRKTTENLGRVGWSQDLPGTN
jgi:hypothetical protein